MIYFTVWIALSLASSCMGLGVGDPQALIENTKQFIQDNSELSTEKKTELVNSLVAFENSLQNRVTDGDLGSEVGSQQYKNEVELLVKCYEAKLPLDSGFGKWLKDDLEMQVDRATNLLSKKTDFTEDEKTAIKKVHDQLGYDLSNLGGAIDAPKMMEHTNWLDNNYDGFKQWQTQKQS